MPTVGVERDELFRRLGRTYTQEEFELLCFEFGIELDDVTSEREMVAKEQLNAKTEELDDTVIYKIDIPANRYDLLCIEGIARALLIFKGLQSAPVYQIVEPAQRQVMRVRPSTKQIRPFVVCAILRDFTFDQKVYKSFIDLQDKLHQNICRGRKLVAIGTHDLDVVSGPFSYSAEPPEDIEFVPLTEEDKVWTGRALLEHYKTDPSCKHLAPYVPLIMDSPVYPVVRDATGTVLSLPPIINGNHSRIKLSTRNVFIECTATDLTKANIVLDTMITMFSEYCTAPFTVEPVDVIYETPVGEVDKVETTPLLSTRLAEATMKDVKGIIGVDIAPHEACELCTKMQLGPADYVAETDSIRVTVPPTRSDILHAVDIVEDVAIAYGFNKLIPGKTPETLAVGAPLPLNHFCDQLRDEIARAGYTEVLTHGLCMSRETFEYLGRKNDGSAVALANPANEEYEVVRTSLLPGLLKTLNHNKSMPKKNGIKFYEISDVVFRDESSDTGARNERHLAALYGGVTAGFEIIHGLVDRVMTLNQVKHRSVGAGSASTYWIEPSDDPAFFPGRAAAIMLDSGEGSAKLIGTFGVVHPEVISKDRYDIDFPCSAVEMNLEHFV
mmetsp:Transcript_29442/g.85831  ORF Transcript_29442/g.85831 Transcript_29442/m.85831 type:complete len:612 (-) Transcript_29442:153-1988(-)